MKEFKKYMLNYSTKMVSLILGLISILLAGIFLEIDLKCIASACAIVASILLLISIDQA